VYPDCGILSGGTIVTINGTFEDRIRPIAVYFGDYLTTEFTLTEDLLVYRPFSGLFTPRPTQPSILVGYVNE